MPAYIEIFLIGLLGSMHCIGMCGGFVAMYSLRKPASKPSLPCHVLYNLGRITTYSLLGGVMGYIGSFFTYLSEARGVPGAVLLIAGLIMVLMGVNLAGVLGKRGLFEDAGIASLGGFRTALRRILALESVWSAYLFGLLLGFLPCGFLYPIFISAAASGRVFTGMFTMAVFGISTMPAMLSMGFLITVLRPRVRLALYRVAAVLVVLLGVQLLLRGMAFNGWIPPARFW